MDRIISAGYGMQPADPILKLCGSLFGLKKELPSVVENKKPGNGL